MSGDSTASVVTFKNVEGFPGYRIGDDGSVWSRREAIRGTRLCDTWHVLNPQKRRGYPRVGMWRNSKLHWRSVHTLVLNAFVGECPEGLECCHHDGDKTNNRLGNLRWDTRKSNAADAVRLGRMVHGESHRSAKLTEDDIPAIRDKVAAGRSCRSVGREYGVSHNVISSVVRRVLWKHVP